MPPRRTPSLERSLWLAVAVSIGAAAGPAGALPVQPCSAPGADCSLREIASAAGLRIGAAAQPGLVAGDPLYGPTLAAEFNSLTAENEMKWPQIHPAEDVWNFAPADALVAFARDNDMRVRGHTLLWANPIRIPDWVNAAPDAVTLHGWLDEHIRTVVGRYADDVDAWDVVNEPLQNLGFGLYENVFFERLGPDYIAEAFRIAHEADPDATLFLNEVLVETPGNPRFDAFYDLVVKLLSEGVPLHGIGFQAHLIDGIIDPDPAQFEAAVRAFADLGLVVEVTEMDVVMPGAQSAEEKALLQGPIYEQFLSACLAVAACQGATFWGFTDRYTWIDGTFGPGLVPLPLDADYARKPAYEGARRALLGRRVPEPATPALWIAALLWARAAPRGPKRG